MSVADTFAACRAAGRAALVAYLPAGLPDTTMTVRAARSLTDAGVDLVEIGLPYSDPVMDGPVIQEATGRALEAGVRTRQVLDVVGEVAAFVPTLVMTYWNPVERYGVDRFASDLAAAGGSGLITPDLLPDEGEEWLTAAARHDLDRVFLVAPSSTDARVRRTVEACRGFVYAAAVMGVTGVRDESSTLAPDLVARVRAVTDLPVGVGIGVSTGVQAAETARYADAVIVGSAFLRCWQQAADPEQGLRDLAALGAELAAGVRGELSPERQQLR